MLGSAGPNSPPPPPPLDTTCGGDDAVLDLEWLTRSHCVMSMLMLMAETR